MRKKKEDTRRTSELYIAFILCTYHMSSQLCIHGNSILPAPLVELASTNRCPVFSKSFTSTPYISFNVDTKPH